MKMTKRIFLTLTVLWVSLMGKAAEKSLFITFTDGSKVEFALATTPEVSVANDQLTVSSTATVASYDLSKVSTFTYGSSTGIGSTQTDNRLAWEGDRLIVSGKNIKIRIFAIDGRSVAIDPIQVGDRTIINMGTLTQGTYIINVNGKSVKIHRK